jgi:DNA-directed RNA polymerase specialized sigma24 family protein
MNPHRNVVVHYVFPAAPERELLEQCDDLVLKAASGDARALSAVVVTFGEVLVGVARRELGTKWESDAEDVVQEIYAAMALGTLASAASALELGEGLPWLKRLVREQAWEQREGSWRGALRPVSPRRRCRW